jgi:kynurenine formamidase
MKYIDLSHKINSTMPVYPGDNKVSLVQEKFLSKDYYNGYTLTTGLHAGTHIDCPMHLLESEKTMLDYDIENFAGDGILIAAEGEEQIDYKPEYEEKAKKGQIVLIYTGMDKLYGSNDYYVKHPVITKKLAQFFVDKEIKLLGVDMPSPDYSPFEVHKLLLAKNILIMENLTNLRELLKVDSFEVFAQPLRLEAEASLVRAIARY